MHLRAQCTYYNIYHIFNIKYIKSIYTYIYIPTIPATPASETAITACRDAALVHPADHVTLRQSPLLVACLDCRYEVHHGVRISDGALVEAAVASDRYIADRFLPDKAIDLVRVLTALTQKLRDSRGCSTHGLESCGSSKAYQLLRMRSQ